jgi:CheY-like chemotaxis protein
MEPPNTRNAPPEPTSPARTILLVEDDADFRVSLAEALRMEGHQVIEAPTGEAALIVLDQSAKTHTLAPDLLVLDLMMPRMSGIEVLQRLRKSPRWASLRVLVITGVNDPMLPVRLDVPIAFKPDPDVVLGAIRQQLTPGYHRDSHPPAPPNRSTKR